MVITQSSRLKKAVDKLPEVFETVTEESDEQKERIN